MKNIKVTVDPGFIDNYGNYYYFLGYKLTNTQSKVLSTKCEYVLVDEEKNKTNASKIGKLRPFIPFYPIIISAFIAITLLTFFLINFYKNFLVGGFYFFMIPALIFMLIATVFSAFKFLNALHNIKVFSSLKDLDK